MPIQKNRFWTPNKLIVLVVLVAHFLLLMELRVEHMDEFGDHWQAWIPLAYSALMIFIGIGGLLFWKKAGRKLLFWAFAVSIIVGILGVWFHDKGKPWKSVTVIVEAWQTPITKKPQGQTKPTEASQKDGKKKKKPKPPLAPLAYAGLGILGMLACSKKEIVLTD